MLKRYAIAAAVAALLVPAITRAQSAPGPTFIGQTLGYRAHGCADAYADTGAVAPLANAFCLDGTITVGRTDLLGDPPTGARFTAFYDLAGTRALGFAPERLYLDYDYAEFFHYPAGGGMTFDEYGPADQPLQAFQFPRGFFYRYILVGDMSPEPTLDARGFSLALTLTPVPEPTTLALTLGGLAILGGMVARRRGTV